VGLFSRFPDDLEAVREAVRPAAMQMALRGKGVYDPDVFNELVASAEQELRRTRATLEKAGRRDDVKKLLKRLLSDGTWMDTPPYNRMYAPFLRDCLGD
jgi:hypothetical protein